ncbi:hypothetical protein PROFUN_13457 [Planoprotostelium fungivorum]|uniref:Uncharacterized protein n=1 Tax=Planoprotostelium fungivorum TaxID=1890364 RepID=A0A2P6N409_9EUKA|nr:hypothetical protein PROFUN_13457 [Planoprotostelium fungivorum]
MSGRSCDASSFELFSPARSLHHVSGYTPWLRSGLCWPITEHSQLSNARDFFVDWGSALPYWLRFLFFRSRPLATFHHSPATCTQDQY